MACGSSQARVKLELHLPSTAIATPTTTRDQNHIWHLHHSSLQCRILNQLSEARDQTHHLMVPSWICFHCATMGTPVLILFNFHQYDRWEMVLSIILIGEKYKLKWCFDLYFSNFEWVGTSFHMLRDTYLWIICPCHAPSYCQVFGPRSLHCWVFFIL